MAKEYDMLVLGGGPAGYPAAVRAAQMGARICLIEQGPIGGVCLNWGCIPTKALHGLAHTVEQVGSGAGAGIAGGPVHIDAEGLFAHKRRVVSELVGGVEKILKARGVDIARGRGRITASGVVDIEGAGTVRGGNLIVATGSVEIELPGIPFDGERVLSSKDLLDLGLIPKSLVVIGGGVIGCEFASIFNAFGTEVAVVEMLPRIIATEDAQVSRYLQVIFKKRGIGLHLGTKALEVERHAAGVTVHLENGEGIDAEYVLVSVGRRPNVEDIGYGGIGLEVARNGITVNSRMETSVRGVYAAGDVVGGWLLAHVATREGIVAVENALGGEREMNYDAIPTTIYTLPEVARVGLTEDEAKKRGFSVVTGRFPFAANGKAKGLREEDGFVKWVADKEKQRLIGLHIIGPQATELLAAGILAVGRGMHVGDFTTAIFPHPTLSEALAEAAEAITGTAIHIVR
ncbi:MAG TPA: dihydrolipoyl dehydrogenase [Patescibacteria group bacterium]|nr:dihydrolipoyl dehydrogenase [Patescibacteria group bacterium]